MTTPNLVNVDTWNADVAANAVKFAASLLLGRGEYATLEAITPEEIILAAQMLKEEHPNSRRDVVIYAIDADGNRTVVSGKPSGPFSLKIKAAKKPAVDAGEPAFLVDLPAAVDSAPAKPKRAAKAKAEKPAAKSKKEKAPKAEKPVKEKAEKKPAKAKAEKPLSARAQAEADAAAGKIPAAPDFSANTHKPYRKKLAALVELVEAGDIAALKAFPINPISTSPKAMDRYRNLAVIALEAKQEGGK